MRQNTWLNDCAKNVHSQKGEDGIIEKALEVLGNASRWCVEFGAWDGKHLSNTYNLMQKGWSGVFIEADSKRFQELRQTYPNADKAYCINSYVNFEGKNTLDSLLNGTPIPKDFGVLSIDIDGNDYHIWDSLKEFKPRIVIIEFNPTIPNHIEFIQPKDMRVNQGSSLRAMVNLGRKKGYELVATTILNAVFVRKEDFSKFEIADNSPEQLFKETKYFTSLFHLYDGTVVLRGCDTVKWHGIKMTQRHLQVVPKIFRVFPSVMSKPKLTAFRVWRKLRSLIVR